MGLDFEYIAGQTPLDEDEKDGLLIDTISTRGELDEFEQKNVEEAVQWMFRTRRFRVEEVLTEKFVTDLHRRMYGKVWGWAGQFRRMNKNIGVDKWQIPTELCYLLTRGIGWNTVRFPTTRRSSALNTDWSISTVSRTATAGTAG